MPVTAPPSPLRTRLYGWAVFAVVVVASTWLFGPLALMVLGVVAGVALILTGLRATGPGRIVLIVAGALLLVVPILLVVEYGFGGMRVVMFG